MSEIATGEPGEDQPALKCTIPSGDASESAHQTPHFAGNTNGGKFLSPVLLRLIEEVRREQENEEPHKSPLAYDRGYTRAIPSAPGKYDRVYNRHNR